MGIYSIFEDYASFTEFFDEERKIRLEKITQKVVFNMDEERTFFSGATCMSKWKFSINYFSRTKRMVGPHSPDQYLIPLFVTSYCLNLIVWFNFPVYSHPQNGPGDIHSTLYTFYLDRPFLFMVLQKDTLIPIITGRIVDPEPYDSWRI